MIDVQGLHKRYAGRAALQGVDFSVPPGEIFGFVGPNGAGKTTTIRILATLTAADAGSATIGGIPGGQDPHGGRELIGYRPDFFGACARRPSEEDLEFYAAGHRVARHPPRHEA